ncbi:MAG: dTDP-glucose 4,6-dehydratase [Deltaproteobacteria bacterium]|nr:dTDP-glucose 4,6-dehydratase [Deltaproteobacteria bacterium]
MKNLFVTGGCGFIGSNFIQYLLRRDDFHGRVINVDTLTYAGNPDNLKGVKEEYPERYFFERADICDFAIMEKIFSDYHCDSICHFAAESHVDRSIKRPDAFINTNIIGTFNLLELGRLNLDTFVLFHHISTDEVYGSLGQKGLFTETTPYRPNSPYSASKASSDHLVRAYNKTYGLPTTISNCSNNYGPYQFPEKLIPLIILNATNWEKLPVYGDGKHIRDWLYVEDHCDAIWAIMKSGKRGETYNIGGDMEIENIRIVEMICDILDAIPVIKGSRSRRELITFVKDRPGHDRRYAIDFTKLKTELNWSPLESFESGMKKTVSWYLENVDWVKRIRNGEYQSWISEQYG